MSGFRLTILATLEQAAYAFRGTGFADWWKNRYVTLQCEKPSKQDTEAVCNQKKGNYTAYFNHKNDNQDYPLISFCPLFFDRLPTLDETLEKTDANHNSEQLNVQNLRCQGTLWSFNCLTLSKIKLQLIMISSCDYAP